MARSGWQLVQYLFGVWRAPILAPILICLRPCVITVTIYKVFPFILYALTAPLFWKVFLGYNLSTTQRDGTCARVASQTLGYIGWLLGGDQLTLNFGLGPSLSVGMLMICASDWRFVAELLVRMDNRLLIHKRKVFGSSNQLRGWWSECSNTAMGCHGLGVLHSKSPLYTSDSLVPPCNSRWPCICMSRFQFTFLVNS